MRAAASRTSNVRRRTVSWGDPGAAPAAASDRSGVEHLAAIASGELPAPPIGALLGIRPVEVDVGRAVFAGEPGEQHFNPVGVVHGGLAAALLDSATGFAVGSTLDPERTYTTVDLKVSYVRPITATTGRVRAEGRVLNTGRSVAVAEGELRVEETDKLLAHATATCLLTPANPQPTRRGGGSSVEVAWADPMQSAAEGMRLNGLDYLRAMRDGRLPPPPMATLMDLELVDEHARQATFEVTPSERHLNPLGVVHGALAATIIDFATAAAVQTTLPPGTGLTSLTLSVAFVRPMTADTPVARCEGSAVHVGRRLATAQGRLFERESDRLLAHGSAAIAVLPPPAQRPPS